MTALRGVSEGEWIRLAGEVLAHHWRTNAPGGLCGCGHEVPLGASFTEHQAAMLVNLTERCAGEDA